MLIAARLISRKRPRPLLQHLGQGSSCFIFLLTRRIAILMNWCGNISRPTPWGAFAALKQALAGLGYLAGRNVKFEERFADGKLERLPTLAAELVTLRVD